MNRNPPACVSLRRMGSGLAYYTAHRYNWHTEKLRVKPHISQCSPSSHLLFTNPLFSARGVDEQEGFKFPYHWVSEVEKAEHLGICAPGEHLKPYKDALPLGSDQ